MPISLFFSINIISDFRAKIKFSPLSPLEDGTRRFYSILLPVAGSEPRRSRRWKRAALMSRCPAQRLRTRFSACGGRRLPRSQRDLDHKFSASGLGSARSSIGSQGVIALLAGTRLSKHDTRPVWDLPEFPPVRWCRPLGPIVCCLISQGILAHPWADWRRGTDQRRQAYWIGSLGRQERFAFLSLSFSIYIIS